MPDRDTRPCPCDSEALGSIFGNVHGHGAPEHAHAALGVDLISARPRIRGQGGADHHGRPGTPVEDESLDAGLIGGPRNRLRRQREQVPEAPAQDNRHGRPTGGSLGGGG